MDSTVEQKERPLTLRGLLAVLEVPRAKTGKRKKTKKTKRETKLNRSTLTVVDTQLFFSAFTIQAEAVFSRNRIHVS